VSRPIRARHFPFARRLIHSPNMESTKQPSAIAIVGPTASGKTSLSITLASHFGGEVISADSRQVYRGMDLGSGKVTPEEMAGIPHHLLDVADPATDIYTAADFYRDGAVALATISSRDKLPIVAGGTFFYLDLLQGKMGTAPVPPNPKLRRELEALSLEQLQTRLQATDAMRADTIDMDNPRRLVRALEIVDALGTVPEVTPAASPYRWLTLGIDIDLDTLFPRIKQRLEERFDAGMIDEVISLHQSGVSYERLESFGLEYRYIAKYLQGELPLDEMKDILATKIRQFAKRQLTWLKRDKSIIWLPFPVSTEVAIKHVEDFLAH
jgi:tRNA dimethylallyltransferase